MQKDQEEKDQTIQQQRNDLSDLEELVTSLQGHVTDKVKLEEVMSEYRKKKEAVSDNKGDHEAGDDEIVHRQQPTPVKSKMCSIM